jgi:bacteriocin-like protein
VVPPQPKRGHGHDEHAITLTDTELNEVTGGLNPHPLPPGPPPELGRSIFGIFRSFGTNQHFNSTSVFRPFSF